MKRLEVPQHGLSLQFVTADALNVDWSDLRGDYCEGFTIVLPRPTYEDIRERAPDLLAEWDDAGEAGDSDEPINNNQLDDFQATDAYAEWADSFEPMMNYAWPVSLPHGGPLAEQAAELIEQYASACSLIEFADGHNPFGKDSDAPEYAIALTGGGMDLSDHIAAAYLCCGCVPPERILSGLGNFTGCNQSGRLSRVPLAEAFERAVDYFRARADRLTEVSIQLERPA